MCTCDCVVVWLFICVLVCLLFFVCCLRRWFVLVFVCFGNRVIDWLFLHVLVSFADSMLQFLVVCVFVCLLAHSFVCLFFVFVCVFACLFVCCFCVCLFV